MKLWPLLWSALRRKPGEIFLVGLAVTAAFTLFGLMLGLRTTYRQLVESSREDRLYVNSRFPLATGVRMPLAMRDEIARMPGVTGVSVFDQIYGYYRDPHNVARIRAVDRNYRLIDYEQTIGSAQWRQLQATPNGVLVSQKVAQRWHLKAGDPLPFIARDDVRADGSKVWQFQVLAIVPDPLSPRGFILGNYGYVDNSRPPASRGQVLELDVAVRDPALANRVSLEIDDNFASSGNPTITIPFRASEENVQHSGFSAASMTWPVAGAAVFMILLVVANGIAQSVRERVPELAVLSAVGFANGTLCTLVVAEAALPCLAGAGLGTVLAAALAGWPARYIPAALTDIPKPTVSGLVAAWAVGSALLLALVSSVPPVVRLRRLSVVDALAGR